MLRKHLDFEGDPDLGGDIDMECDPDLEGDLDLDGDHDLEADPDLAGDPDPEGDRNLEGDPDLAGDSDLESDSDLEGHPGFERALSDVDPFPKARERILNGNARHANNNQRARYAPRVPPHQPGHEEVGNPFSIAFNAKWNRLNSHTLTRRLSTTQTRLVQTKACPVTRQRESNCFDHA